MSIVPSQQRSKKESEELADFQYTMESVKELSALIESAKVIPELDKPGCRCSSDILRIKRPNVHCTSFPSHNLGP